MSEFSYRFISKNGKMFFKVIQNNIYIYIYKKWYRIFYRPEKAINYDETLVGVSIKNM